MRIAIVASSPMTINAFLHDQIMRLSVTHHVMVVTNIDDPAKLAFSSNNVEIKSINIPRKLSFWKDVKAFYLLLKLFVNSDFDMVYSVTPKSGLLAMLASLVARVRCRVHTFTGQVWVTRTGVKRLFLKSMDQFIASLSTHALADSKSQRQFLIDEKVVSEEKVKVLANGSISGVNLQRFNPDKKVKKELRKELNINESDVVILFLGRLSNDKGILDLASAFKMLVDQDNSVKLVIVGPDEEDMRNQILATVGVGSERLRMIDFTDHPEHYMNVADIFCLPSYREGFGSVVIEAAAVGIPAVGSDIYGIKDAIENNVTGLLFPVRDIRALHDRIKTLVINNSFRQQLGDAARQRAQQLFSQDFVTSSFVDYFENVMNNYRLK